MTRESKHPQIFSDIVVLFEIYYRIHEGMPKSFRVAVSEKVLDRLSNAMHFIILANNVDKKTKIGKAFDLLCQKAKKLLNAYFHAK